MPSSPEHKEKAEKNIVFLGQIQTISPEWTAIVAFYSALHLVERLCACESIHNGKHQDRMSWLNRHKKHRAIHADFLALLDASLIARYGTVNQFMKAFPFDSAKKNLVDEKLAAIEMYVAKHFVTTSPPVAPPHKKSLGVKTE